MEEYTPENMPRAFKGVWTPREIWLHPGLSALQKVLWSEISFLDKDEGCFASNAYLAQFCGIHERKVQEHLRVLKEKGLIEVVNFDGRKRILKAIDPVHLRGAENGTPTMPKTAPIGSSLGRISKDILNTSRDAEASTDESLLNTLSLDVIELTDLLWKEISTLNPKTKEPNLSKWAQEMDLMLRRDKRDAADVRKIIEFVFTDSFWYKVIQSPQGLRRNFDKIWMKMIPIASDKAREEENRKTNMLEACQARAQLKSAGSKTAADMFLSDKELVHLDSGERILLSLSPDEFTTKMLKAFKLTKEE